MRNTFQFHVFYFYFSKLGECKFKAEDLRFTGIGCDVSSEESVIKAFAIIMEKYQRLDAVVASAGIVENYSALEYVARYA